MTPRRSLFRKYVVYLVTLVSAALIVSGCVGLYFTYEENKAALLNLQREKALAAASRIETYILDIERQLAWMSFPGTGKLGAEDRRVEYLKLLEQVEAITEARFIDNDGREQVRVSLGPAPDDLGSGKDFSNDPKFRAPTLNAGYFSPVYFQDDTEPYMTIAVAGRRPGIGVTAAEVRLKFIGEVISRIEVSKGVAYVVDSNGLLIAHPNISKVLRKTDLSKSPQVMAARRADELAMLREKIDGSALAVRTRGRSASMSAGSLEGEDALYAYASIPSLGWHVFVEQSLTEAFAPLYASIRRTGFLLVAGLLLAVTLSLFLVRHMVRPIRAIRAGAARIAAGKLDQRIEVCTSDELELLAEEFNNMAAQLRESYASLERKVDERTRDLSESLEQQTATSEVLKTISRSSFDLDLVLEELIKCVVKLGRGDAGALYLRQSDTAYELQTAYSEDANLHRLLVSEARQIDPESNTATGRAIASRQPAQIDDIKEVPGYQWPNASFRTALAVPILREGIPIGVIVVLKSAGQPFTEKQIALITTFADQAGIAMENMRLFKETQDKGVALELANRHKSEFLANVSHELRTPLNAIIGFSEVLRERMFGDINEKQAEYLDDIHSSGRHLLSLINDILNLSKIEAGQMDLELARFDIGEALQSALNVVRERASRQHIQLALELEPDIGDWTADQRKFKQIMLNLLSNALKFTPDGGKIAVRVTRAERGLEISVADTGIGISPAHVHVIFDEFRQVAADHPRKSEGTGLGLALTKKYVELHGGSIEVRSELGNGSIFIISLPEISLEAI